MATAMNMKTGVLAGMAIAATFACAAPEDRGGNNNQDASGMPDSGNPQNDGGSANGGADGGTPDGGLDVARLKRLVEGRYIYLDYGNPKNANMEVRVCENNLYPPSVVCLFTRRFGEHPIGTDWSLMTCDKPLNTEGKCLSEDYSWYRGRIWRCNCDAIARRSPEDAANCAERNDPQSDCEDWGGGNNWGVVVQTESCNEVSNPCDTSTMNPDHTLTFRRYF